MTSVFADAAQQESGWEKGVLSTGSILDQWMFVDLAGIDSAWSARPKARRKWATLRSRAHFSSLFETIKVLLQQFA